MQGASKGLTLIASSDRDGVDARLRQNPHRPAAHEAGVPGEILGQRVRAQRSRTARQDFPARKNRIRLDTSAAERSSWSFLLIVGDDELRADNLRCTALRADNRGNRELAASGDQVGDTE